MAEWSMKTHYLQKTPRKVKDFIMCKMGIQVQIQVQFLQLIFVWIYLRYIKKNIVTNKGSFASRFIVRRSFML